MKYTVRILRTQVAEVEVDTEDAQHAIWAAFKKARENAVTWSSDEPVAHQVLIEHETHFEQVPPDHKPVT